MEVSKMLEARAQQILCEAILKGMEAPSDVESRESQWLSFLSSPNRDLTSIHCKRSWPIPYEYSLSKLFDKPLKWVAPIFENSAFCVSSEGCIENIDFAGSSFDFYRKVDDVRVLSSFSQWSKFTNEVLSFSCFCFLETFEVYISTFWIAIIYFLGAARDDAKKRALRAEHALAATMKRWEDIGKQLDNHRGLCRLVLLENVVEKVP